MSVLVEYFSSTNLSSPRDILFERIILIIQLLNVKLLIKIFKLKHQDHCDLRFVLQAIVIPKFFNLKKSENENTLICITYEK